MIRDGFDISALTQDKQENELRLVGCFLNDMTSMSAVEISSEMIYHELPNAIFRVVSKIYEGGFEKIDRHSLSHVLEKDKELYSDWEANMLSYDIMMALKKEYSGIESDVESYYDAVRKTHIVVSLFINNIKTNVMLASKADDVPLEEIKDIVEYNSNGIFLQGLDCDEEDLSFYDEDEQELIDGSGIGLEYGLSYTTKKTNGLHKGGLNGLAGSKGTGKSTIMLTNFCIEILEQNEKVTIVSNEMTRKKIQNILIPFIMATRFGDFTLSRTKFMRGNFDGVNMDTYRDAKQYFNALMENVNFIMLKSFSKENLIGIVRKYAKQGCDYFFFDTFKSDFSNGDNLTVNLMNIIQNLSQECIDLDVCGMFTMQLKTVGKHRRYLDDSALARCSEAGQDLDQLLLFRDVFDDEYSGESCDLKPYSMERVDNAWAERTVNLDPKKKYILVFLDKTRHGENGSVTVAEKNTAFSIFNEKAHVHVKDSPSSRGGGY